MLIPNRSISLAGGVIAVLMVIVGILAAVDSARRGFSPVGAPPPLVFLAIPLFMLVVFAVMVGAALYYRREPQTHKRLMLLATVGGLMWPAITRMPYVAGRPILMFALLGALVLASAVRDVRRRSPIRLISLGGGLLILAAFPIRVAIGLTDRWHALAAWLIR